MISIIVIIALLLIILLQEIIHSRERKDLYTRLMSRDLQEYKYITKSDANENDSKTKQGTNLLRKRIKTSYRQLHGEDGGDREV